MALTTYRSIVQVTQGNREAVYEAVACLCRHAHNFNVNILRIQYMSASQKIEVDFSDPIPVGQIAHLGLTGPV